MAPTDKTELDLAYKKIEQLEEQVIRLDRAVKKQYQIERLLIAAGFLTEEKIRQADEILEPLN